MTDPHSRESRGFAFVTMVRSEDAEAAMQVLNGFELHGRPMSVKLASESQSLSFLYETVFTCSCLIVDHPSNAIRRSVVALEPQLRANTVDLPKGKGSWVCPTPVLMVSQMEDDGETSCSRLVKNIKLTIVGALLDRRVDRFDPRYDPRAADPRAPDPRDYRGGGPIRGDYGRPPYDRYDRDYDR